MKDHVLADFEKYQHSIKQIYFQRLQKQLIIVSSGLVASFLLVLLTTGELKVLGFALLVASLSGLVFTLLNYQKITSEIAASQAYWLSQIEEQDFESPDGILYEDEDNYYLSQDQKDTMSKKGSRTMPSMIRGLSLIAGSNQKLWSMEQQVYVVYCDTVNIRPVDLGKANSKVLQTMKWQKVKNKVIRPLISLAIAALVIWYLLSWF